eukprot:g3218.t1
MKGADGKVLRNAHLRGTFFRLCKLLFNRVKPVVVFDGGAPVLKRKTQLRRKEQKERQDATVRMAARRLLLKQVKMASRDDGGNLASNFVEPAPASVAVPAPAITPSTAPAPAAVATKSSSFDTVSKREKVEETRRKIEKRRRIQEKMAKRARRRGLTRKTSRSRRHDDISASVLDASGRVDEDVYTALPPKLQQEVAERLDAHHRADTRRKYLSVAAKASEFSSVQLDTFLSGSRTRATIRKARFAQGHSTSTRTIASDSNRSFVVTGVDVASFDGLFGGGGDLKKKKKKKERVGEESSRVSLIDKSVEGDKNTFPFFLRGERRRDVEETVVVGDVGEDDEEEVWEEANAEHNGGVAAPSSPANVVSGDGGFMVEEKERVEEEDTSDDDEEWEEVVAERSVGVVAPSSSPGVAVGEVTCSGGRFVLSNDEDEDTRGGGGGRVGSIVDDVKIASSIAPRAGRVVVEDDVPQITPSTTSAGGGFIVDEEEEEDIGVFVNATTTASSDRVVVDDDVPQITSSATSAGGGFVVDEEEEETGVFVDAVKTASSIAPWAGRVVRNVTGVVFEDTVPKISSFATTSAPAPTRRLPADETRDDVIELLRLMGVPYVVSPGEAEAQCAQLERLGLVDGVITDDSDILLFGGRRVYRNFFQHAKVVEEYRATDVANELGLSRGRLVALALLLGCDYTDGIRGVGIVNACEILARFRGQKRKGDKEEEERSKTETVLTAFKSWNEATIEDKKKKKWVVPDGFPSKAVVDAFFKPSVDSSTEPFSWSIPNANALISWCERKLDWDREKASQVVTDLVRATRANAAQPTLGAWFRSYRDDQKVAEVSSLRLGEAITALRGVGDKKKRAVEEEEGGFSDGEEAMWAELGVGD